MRHPTRSPPRISPSLALFAPSQKARTMRYLYHIVIGLRMEYFAASVVLRRERGGDLTSKSITHSRCSSATEQRSHTAKVGCSTQPTGTSLRRFAASADRPAAKRRRLPAEISAEAGFIAKSRRGVA